VPVAAADPAGPALADMPADTLPPAPPEDWRVLPNDVAIIFGIELVGPNVIPWTKPKSWVFNNVLTDRYLRAVDVKNIETGAIETYYFSVPDDAAAGDDAAAAALGRRGAAGDPGAGMVQMGGVHLRVTVVTNSLRVESEVRAVAEGVASGALAADLSRMLGAPVTNVTLTAQPTTVPYDKIPDPNASTGGSVPGWAIGVLIGCILVLAPVPCYLCYRRQQRKHVEAVEKQQAEAAATRQRMQSRVIGSGSKAFAARGAGSGALTPGGGGGGGGSLLAATPPYAGSLARGASDPNFSRPGSYSGGHGRAASPGGGAGGAPPSPAQLAALQRRQHSAVNRALYQAASGAFTRPAVLPVAYPGDEQGSTSSGGRSSGGR
jgi:hypothetical protein